MLPFASRWLLLLKTGRDPRRRADCRFDRTVCEKVASTCWRRLPLGRQRERVAIRRRCAAPLPQNHQRRRAQPGTSAIPGEAKRSSDRREVARTRSRCSTGAARTVAWAAPPFPGSGTDDVAFRSSPNQQVSRNSRTAALSACSQKDPHSPARAPGAPPVRQTGSEECEGFCFATTIGSVHPERLASLIRKRSLHGAQAPADLGPLLLAAEEAATQFCDTNSSSEHARVLRRSGCWNGLGRCAATGEQPTFYPRPRDVVTREKNTSITCLAIGLAIGKPPRIREAGRPCRRTR